MYTQVRMTKLQYVYDVSQKMHDRSCDFTAHMCTGIIHENYKLFVNPLFSRAAAARTVNGLVGKGRMSNAEDWRTRMCEREPSGLTIEREQRGRTAGV